MHTKYVSEEELETVPLKTTPAIQHYSVKEPDIDKINSLTQKEKNLEKSGVTRIKYMKVIADALVATITKEYRDVSGNVCYRKEPDFEKNKWGAEQAAKLLGDMIERKEVEHSGELAVTTGIADWFKSRPRKRVGSMGM